MILLCYTEEVIANRAHNCNTENHVPKGGLNIPIDVTLFDKDSRPKPLYTTGKGGPITPTPQCTCLAPVFAYISFLAIVHPPSISYTLILLILSSQHSTTLNCTPIRFQYPSIFALQFVYQLAP
jgi:hypothetical protein